jgi:FAD binding domain/D-arabinono-1,4-lactone oxidase
VRAILVSNFGRNVRFTPARIYTPRNEDEVLELLEGHTQRSIRVIGSLHSWSDAAETGDILVDMRRFDWIAVPDRTGEEIRVTVGAGCRIRRLMRVLRTKESVTLPTVGTVMEQTVAGAISTGTHGSGRPSLSHFVRAIRVAAYDSQGRPAIYDWYEGATLEAARCGLGCTGIVLSVTFACVPAFEVCERVRVHDSIAPILSAVAEHPLQEFALVPHKWTYVAYQRRESQVRSSGWKWCALLLYRAYKWAMVDCFLHAALKTLLFPCVFGHWGIALSNRFVRFLYRATPLLIGLARMLTGDRGVVDRSDRALTRKHHYFRHVEMEIFVPEAYVTDATALIRSITAVCAGDSVEMSEAVRQALVKARLLERVDALRGTYLHHYPLYFRRVLPDDTLISMTSRDSTLNGRSPYYAIGLFCYLGRRRRRRYFEYASVVALAMIRTFGARLHWGKYLPVFPDTPLTHLVLEPLYPALPEFRRVCDEVDPRGVFRNSYSRRVLNLAPVETAADAPQQTLVAQV